MSDAEVAACTGLSVAAATRARRRRCSEPLQWLDTAAAFAQFRQAVETAGLQLVQGGRFWHLMGSHDKASAMQRLCEQYRAAGFQGFSTVALGDSPNDIPMLEAVDIPLNFFPRSPGGDIEGRIISVVDGVTQIGQYQVVVMNRGTNNGLSVGDVLTVWQTGETVDDRIGGGSVRLPDEAAGTVMVFKTYDRISYGLVMEATQAIHIHDFVRNPT